MRIELNDYVDHMLECETKIETCRKCGPEYRNNDIHREPGKHSKVTQQFNCMECMQAMGTRIRIARNHKTICQESGTEEFSKTTYYYYYYVIQS